MRIPQALSPKIIWTILKVKAKHLSFLETRALWELAYFVGRNEKKQIPGLIIEAGAALGGSSLVIAAAKNRQRLLFVYDTFEGIPPPGENDGEDAHKRFQTILKGKAKGLGHQPYYGYLGDLLPIVTQNFEEFGYPLEKNGVSLIKGLIEKRLEVDQPVSLVHVDCDWYSPVKTCLERVAPFLVPGGRFIIDDYDHWSGARRAVDEFLSNSDSFSVERWSRIHLIKK